MCPRSRATFLAGEVRVHQQWLQWCSSEPEPLVLATWERQQSCSLDLSLGTVCPGSVGLVRTETEASQQGHPKMAGKGRLQGGCGRPLRPSSLS